VEGANIFITAEARTKLFENGNVVIVKDSSANKVSSDNKQIRFTEASFLVWSHHVIL
jgi:hypothetical protein